MCLPLAALAIGTTVAAGGISAFGQVQAGRANNRIAQSNADRMDLSAADLELSARTESETTRLQFGQIVGTQRAGLSGANVDISRGSASNLSAATAAVGELEVLRALTNASREAYGIRTQAAMTRVEGKMARQQGMLGAAGTLLGTAGTAFGMRATQRQAR